MHNLKSNYDKFLSIVKESLKECMLPDGNYQRYRNKPKLSDIEIVTLAVCSTPHKHRQWLSSIFESLKPLKHEKHLQKIHSLV
jgi:hypothetical protein